MPRHPWHLRTSVLRHIIYDINWICTIHHRSSLSTHMRGALASSGALRESTALFDAWLLNNCSRTRSSHDPYGLRKSTPSAAIYVHAWRIYHPLSHGKMVDRSAATCALYVALWTLVLRHVVYTIFWILRNPPPSIALRVHAWHT